ncbi:MAG TPA: porin family protein, partial [Flavisolibacter sp.]|nr:porin family protein [Flavisolibacter sp.]
ASGTTPATHSEQDLGYINLPIMLQWKSQGGFFVETGPQAGYLVRAKLESGNTTSVDNKDNYDKFDFSWGAGLGYLSRIGLGINARYNLGLSNVIEDNGGNNSSNDGPELKNKVIQIGLFWQFGAGK